MKKSIAILCLIVVLIGCDQGVKWICVDGVWEPTAIVTDSAYDKPFVVYGDHLHGWHDKFGKPVLVRITLTDPPWEMKETGYSVDTLPYTSEIPETDQSRYFMVSYTVFDKDGQTAADGNSWFPYPGFPPFTRICEFIYSGMSMKRECYSNIIMRSIYEFRDRQDCC